MKERDDKPTTGEGDKAPAAGGDKPPAAGGDKGNKPADGKAEWPKMPEDPVQDRSAGEGDCPCYIRLRYIKIEGSSVRIFGKILVSNPHGRQFYHSALEVQAPIEGICRRFSIELLDYVSDPEEAKKRGQVVTGGAAGIGSSAGTQYGIFLTPDGKVDGGDDPDIAHAGRRIVSRDCDKVRKLVQLVPQIPPNDYSSDWTSNSIISWLLEKIGLDPSKIEPPVDGMTPSWSNGIAEAKK
jgi:hypothetical protein